MILGHDNKNIGDKVNIIGVDYRLGEKVQIKWSDSYGLFKEMRITEGYLIGKEPAKQFEVVPKHPDWHMVILSFYNPKISPKVGGKGGPKKTRCIYENDIVGIEYTSINDEVKENAKYRN